MLTQLKSFIVYSIASILIFFTACPDYNPNIYIKNSSFPDTIMIQYGDIVYYPEELLSIRFTNIFSDSRCPTGVVCDWEGVADIELSIRKNSQSEIYIPLQIYGYVFIENIERHMSVDTLGYHVTLMDLSPYPDAFEEHDTTEYIATMLINKPERIKSWKLKAQL